MWCGKCPPFLVFVSDHSTPKRKVGSSNLLRDVNRDRPTAEKLSGFSFNLRDRIFIAFLTNK